VAKSQEKNDRLAYILLHLKDPEAILEFSSSLQDAIKTGIKSGSYKEYDLVLETWEAIAMLEASEDAQSALRNFIEGKREHKYFPIA